MPDTAEPAAPGLSRGFVLAASGRGYTEIAVNAAQSLREVCPDAAIDLFTDAPPEGPHPFDRVHALEKTWHRPKFEALRRSRFDLTVYMDNDIVVLADISDVFEVLERHDVMGAHNELRSTGTGVRVHTRPLPNAYPQINGGFLGIRRSPATLAFLDDVERAMDEGQLNRDQAVIRELLFDSDLRLAVLPGDYNFMRHVLLKGMKGNFAAPRVLHLRRLQEHLRDGGRPVTSVRRIIGWRRLWRLQWLLDRDRTLAGKRKRVLLNHPLRRFVRRDRKNGAEQIPS